MRNIQDLREEYCQTNPVPIKPKKIYKDRNAGILTDAYAKFQQLQVVHFAQLSQFIGQKIGEQTQLAGIKQLPVEFILAWEDANEYGWGDHECENMVKEQLMTESQRKWLYEHQLDYDDLLCGRYSGNFDEEVRDIFFKSWNDILEANGLPRDFGEGC
jgi:hypothetical protein